MHKKKYVEPSIFWTKTVVEVERIDGELVYYPNTPTLRQLEELKFDLDTTRDRAKIIEAAMRIDPAANTWRMRPDLVNLLKQVDVLKPMRELKTELEANLDKIRTYEKMIQFVEAAPYPCQFECAECVHRAAANRQDAVKAAGKGTLACGVDRDTRRSRTHPCPQFKEVFTEAEAGDRISLIMQFGMAADAGISFADFVASA